MSSHTGTARTNAEPEVNLTVTDSATVGSVSRFAFTWPFTAAALTSQHCGQKPQAEAWAAVYPFAGLGVQTSSFRYVRNCSSPIWA